MTMLEVETRPCLGCKQTTWFSMTQEQYNRWKAGEHAQDVFPDWSPGDREMLISGTCPECWDEMWAEEEEDNIGWVVTDQGLSALGSALSGMEGYLSGDESADWRDSDKDWYPED